MRKTIVSSLVVLMLVSSFGFASAIKVGGGTTGTSGATNNVTGILTSTIKDSGPRSETGNSSYFNVEGSTAGGSANESYGVLRFDVSAVKSGFDTQYGAGNWSISSVNLSLTQSNASFTHSGNVYVYYTDNDTLNIKTGSTLVFPDQGSPLSPGTLLATYNFPTTGNVNSGTIDNINLLIGDGLTNKLLAGGNLTLTLIADAATAATWEGQTGYATKSYEAPFLTVNAVPEPATLIILGLGSIATLRYRK